MTAKQTSQPEMDICIRENGYNLRETTVTLYCIQAKNNTVKM